MDKDSIDAIARIDAGVRQIEADISGHQLLAESTHKKVITHQQEREWFTKNVNARCDALQASFNQLRQEMTQLRAEFDAMKAGFRAN